MSADVLSTARKALTDALGDKTKQYFDHMKQWFKMKITKEEFDAEARKLLSPEQIHLHNKFFLAILNKVEGLAEVTAAPERTFSHTRSSSSNKKHRHSSRSTSDKSNFETIDILDYVAPGSPPGAGSEALRYAAQELFLPDHALVTGRFMITAWEQGLEGTDDETIDLIVAAVQVFLKNILTVIITQRKGYKVREDNFVHDIGSDVPNVWLRNTANLVDPTQRCPTELDDTNENLVPACPYTIDEMEQATAYNMACSIPQFKNRQDRVSLIEVYEALKIHRNAIASHSVYAINMERIVTALRHPSYSTYL